MELKNVCQPPEYTMDDFSEFFEESKARALRLSEIESIIDDDYDLDRLRELVEADREGRCHIGRCAECTHYEGLAVCEFLGECGGTNWICGWFKPKKSAGATMKGEKND